MLGIKKTSLNKSYSLEHLFLSERLEERATSSLILITILLICVLIISALIWSAFAYVDEVSSVNGTIVPSANIYQIQHLEGGKVLRVHKSDGEYVEQGSIIMELSPDSVNADLSRLRNRVNVLNIDITRLQTYIANEDLTREKLIASLKYKDSVDPEVVDVLISNTLLLFHHQVNSAKIENYDIEFRLEKQRHNLHDIDQQLAQLSEREQILHKQIDMYERLVAKEAASQLNYLNTKDKHANLIADILEVERERTGFVSKINELESKLKNNQVKVVEEALEQLNDFSSELIENTKQINKLESKLVGLRMKAPITGYIQGFVARPGSVIRPADVILEIVPIAQGMLVEAQIDPEDIGYVKVNDPAKVKFTSYDFSMFGHVDGTVIKLSPSTFMNDENLPYYKAVIHLEKGYVGKDPTRNPILPGMTVIADIHTGSKTVLKYFMKPVTRTWKESFHEK